MGLSAGTKLGPYEIRSPLGAGGMGEVYLARDTRLGRDVAVKILQAHLSDRPDARERFEREARAISSLGHPSICHLYDVGEEGGTHYLVMEYLEGETLAARLQKGRLPLEQVLRYGVEIADGLEKAHRSGITHRDLKPGNIMLTPSGAKLMDFGLAKAALPSSPPASMMTRTAPLTGEGLIVGTFQYMSPEQVEGKAADPRSDLFALGAVLFEMLTGSRAFEGATTASLIAAILASQPKPIASLQPLTPPALDHLIRTCLAKDPDQRWQSAGDVARQLRWISQEDARPAAAAPAAARRGARIAWAAAVVLLGLVAAYWTQSIWQHAPAPMVQFQVDPPGKTYFNFRGLSGPPVPSPDGRYVAFVAFAQDQTGASALWLRPLSSSDATLVPGSDGATYPFWSPDSHFLGFFAQGKMKKLDLATHSLTTLCAVAEGRGGAWSTKGVILFGNRTDSLFKVDALGGKPVRLTTLDEAHQETSHRWPQFLPDQNRFLFISQAPELPSGHLFFAALDAPLRKALDEVTSSALYVDGNLFYTLENNLTARRFDPHSLQFSGDPVVLAGQVQTDSQFNFAAFSVSKSVMTYQTGAVAAGTWLVAFDRGGKETILSRETDLIQSMTLSPAGDQIVASLGLSSGQLSDIWIYNLAKNSKSKLTFDHRSDSPIWSPDGTRIAFSRVVPDGSQLVVKNVSGGGSEEVLYTEKKRSYPVAWSPDGRYLVYRLGLVAAEIKALPLAGERRPETLVTTRSGWAGASLSPDGKWLAYVADESGVTEVYVVPFRPASGGPGASGEKWQVSNGGGTSPVWRPDGTELFFTSGSSTGLMSAAVRATADRFESDAPRFLFEEGAHPVGRFFAPARDGRTVYMSTYGPGSTAPFTVTVNWQELLKK